MRVEFLQDFQGVETREQFFYRKQVVDLPDAMASLLIKEGRAKAVAEKPAAKQSAPKPSTTSAKKKGATDDEASSN